MKILLIPFRSSLKASVEQEHLIAELAGQLTGVGGIREVHPCECSDSGIRPVLGSHPGSIPVILALSGGIEGHVLRALSGYDGPVFILAHPHGNSLPASLEILACLQQQGRTGRVVFARPGFAAELAELCNLAEINQRFHSARIGVVGEPSDWLVASRPADSQVRTVWGSELVRIPVGQLLESYTRETGWPGGDREGIIAEFTRSASSCREPEPETMAGAARLYRALQTVIADNKLTAITIRCFDLLKEPGNTGCFAVSRLNDEGIPSSCEGDVPALLTMMLMQWIDGKPVFMANPAEADRNEGRMILAHCTIPRQMVSGYAIRSHFESGIGAAIQGDIPDGPITIARIGGSELQRLFVAEGQVYGRGYHENLCRTQVHLRLEPTAVQELLENPLGNHHILAAGKLGGQIRDYHRMFIAPSR